MYSQSTRANEEDDGLLIACHECDSLNRVATLPPGQRACCARCGATLIRNPKGGLDGVLALNLAALILFILANSFPLLTLSMQGVTSTATLSQASQSLHDDGQEFLAMVVFASTILGPGAMILSSLYVGIAARWVPMAPGARWVLARISAINPWAMLDVFMLGILVSVVKLMDLADVVVGPALYAFAILIFVAAGAAAAFEPQLLWARLDRRHV